MRDQRKKDIRNMAVSGALILAFAGMAAFAGGKLYGIYQGYRLGETVYGEMEEIALKEEEDGGSGAFPEVDFQALQEVNSEVVGWIYGEGTAVNYPVAGGDDNEYYLNHLFGGERNMEGCIFLDHRNSRGFSDPNSILYGHHLRNGSMFASLTEYEDQEYYERHPEFLLMTPEADYRVEVFAAYAAAVEDDAWRVDFETEEEALDWAEERIGKSSIRTGISPEKGDRILTLSTCCYEFEDARFVVFGILREE